jgi:hypothetical protein
VTVAVTAQRLQAALALIRRHADAGLPAPTNYQLALAMGMGEQRYQPHDRVRGLRSRKPEAGTVVVRALEILGRIEVQRIGRNRRTIRIVEG